jgi:type IV pilus assembly protein PilC
MTYPATVVGIAVIVISVIMVFVIPSFEKMFADFGSALPTPTQIVINLSNFIRSWILAIIGAMVLLAFIFKRFYKTPKGRALVDAYVLKLPVFGVLLRKVAVAKFSRTLGTMIASGVPILDGLEIVAKTAGNKTVENAIFRVKQSISEGKTIAEPLEKTGVFPPMVCQMVAVGEQSGSIDSMLNKIADFYDDEVDEAVNNLTAMMEPMLMLFLGTTVGALVIAMYLPIFKIAGAVGG